LTLPGGLVSVLILLPNLLWMLLPQESRPEHSTGVAKTGWLNRWMEALEWVGRIATLVIPFLYRIEPQSTGQVLAVTVMALALLVYYAGWTRYFVRGRRHAHLFEPLLGVPLPLAISPIIYYLAATVLFGSWTLALATVILGVSYLWISLQESRDVLRRA